MSFFDRVQEVIPHTARAWVEAIVIAVILGVLIFVVLPRLVKPRLLRWGIAAGLLLVAGWFTVLPVFFDKQVNEALPAAASSSPSTTATTVNGGATATTEPTTAVTQPTGPVKLTSGQLRGLAGHYGRGAASVYRLADGSHIVRLEEIDTPRAPAVFVYLVPKPGQSGTDGYVDLGALKGNQGSQNYVVPADVDVSKFQTVLLWCRRFSTPIANATQTAV